MDGLLAELVDELTRFAHGEHGLSALRDWLLGCAEEIAASDDTRVRALAGEVWLLIGEHEYEHRQERELRAEVGRLLAARSTEPSPVPARL